MSILILQGPQLNHDVAESIARRVGGRLDIRTTHYRVHTHQVINGTTVQNLRAELPYDINLLPDTFDASAQRLLLTDMDSTLINIEGIDEVADFAGLKSQVAAITQTAMRGEIRFEDSFIRRTALLTGLDAVVLERVYRERLRPNPGAKELIAGLKARSIRSALVSGGFTYFTERLKADLSLDYSRANTIEITDGKITGRVLGNIIGAEGKRDFLLELCEKLQILPNQTIAVGDGANDLLMMAHAGLSIGYHAKPNVQAKAQVLLNHSGLDGILAFLE